ncbi:MAG: hypothetical protein EOP38_27115 [Rubrivivax sp.]|nr:MAG: hypothetical protein EOP38_27115 [Rubrivivax sp.]
MRFVFSALYATPLLLGCAAPLAQAVAANGAQPGVASQAPVVALASPGKPASSRADSIAPLGYVEQEFILRGQARTYAKSGSWGADGHWGVAPAGDGQAYTTRLLVRRPKDAAKFNGIVVVEWLNTTLGFDLDGAWALTRDELTREGYAWVGVTTEASALDGLRKIDATRYASSQIGHDDLSFDIFSQAGQAVRQHGDALLGQTRPVKLLAAGYSKSAVFLNTYINAFQPDLKIYDGFFMHGRAPYAMSVATKWWGAFSPPIRADLAAPVLQVQSEMEISVSWSLSKTPDTDKVRYWEVAGAAHFDQRVQEDTRAIAPPDYGSQPPPCLKPISALPLYEVDNAALNALRQWVVAGTPPPKAARMQRNALGFVKHDDQGHALGGLRLPEIDVPVAGYGTYSNFASGSFSERNLFACVAGGSTKPWPEAELRQRYPSRDAYLNQYKAAADAALAAGFLRPDDHAAALKRAQLTRMPW